jgi:hypothetical protein
MMSVEVVAEVRCVDVEGDKDIATGNGTVPVGHRTLIWSARQSEGRVFGGVDDWK